MEENKDTQQEGGPNLIDTLNSFNKYSKDQKILSNSISESELLISSLVPKVENIEDLSKEKIIRVKSN